MQRKFKKRLPTAWGYVSKLFLLPLSVRALSLVPRTTLTRNRLRPLWCLWRPLILPSIHLCPSKTLLSSWSSVVICALIARGKLKPELEFQAGTSCSYHALYKHENIGYAEAPDDHMYNTQNSERSDEVSPYLMVAGVQVPVRKLLLSLLSPVSACYKAEAGTLSHYMPSSSCSRRQRYQVIWWLVMILDDILHLILVYSLHYY